MRKRGREKRNTVIFIAGLVVLSLLTWLVISSSREIQIIDSELPKKTAMRESQQDNAYYVFAGLPRTVPKVPQPLIVPHPTIKNSEVEYRPKKGSLGELLGLCKVNRPDDDPEFIQYVEGWDPELEAARSALDKPYYLLPEIGTWTRHAQSYNIFPTIMTARAVVYARTQAPDTKAFDYLFDAVRLGRMVISDGTTEQFRLGCREQSTALSYVNELVSLNPSDEMLEEAARDLAALAADLPTPRANFEFMCRQLDNSQTFEDLFGAEYAQDMSTPEKFLHSYATRRLRRFLEKRIDVLLEVAEYDLLQFRAWRSENWDQYDIGWFHILWDPTWDLAYSLQHRATLDARFRGAQLVIALEQYRRAHGAYPESLDALPTDLPEKCRIDPFTGDPFVYRLNEDDYVLYSVGENQKPDEDKHRHTKLDVVIHEPPTP